VSDPRTVILDFETFYDMKAGYHLRRHQKGLTTPEYIHDPRFKVHGLAYDLDGKQEFLRPPAIPAFLETVQDDIIVMHNAYFDAGILTWRYKFRPAFMLDTIAIANHVLGAAVDGVGGKKDLATLSEKLSLEAGSKGDLSFMDGVRDPDEAQLLALGAYACQDVRLGRGVLDTLLPHVGNEGFEFWLLDHTLRIYTEKLLAIDTDKLKAAAALIDQARKTTVAAGHCDLKVLASNKQFGVELEARMRRAKLKLPTKRGKRGIIPALAKGDPEFIALTDCEVPDVADLVKARLAERSAITVAARLATMRRYAALGGIPVQLVYYGAHTGRFAGGGGFNFHNFTSPGRAADEFTRTVAIAVRECIVPGEGNVFVDTDASQIEARVEAWLADETLLTEAFRAKEDVYSTFIGGALEEDIHKPTDADPKDNHLYLKLMRQVGKEAVLGLGFSMGVDKWRERLAKEKNLLPMLKDGAKLNLEVCQGIVDHYRNTYTNIVQFWDDLNKAFTAAIHGATRRVGKLLFKKVGPRAVGIVLPSGRTLYYRDLRQVPEKGPRGMIRRVWRHGSGKGQRIYGGLLAENVSQAVARDILAEAIYAMEQAGYPVVLHVHDSIINRVPRRKGQDCLAFAYKTLTTPPEWGEGLVLDAEGHVGENLL
jgi:hypothetical protein